jgi:tRNA(Ile)-lysidine synthase
VPTTPADRGPDLLARCTFPPPGVPVVAAVSGGADSTALLALAVDAGCDVTAVHVDHGLRPGSAAEADHVAALAASLGVPFRAERVELAPGPNLEARARDARRAALGPGAMTGHTADDRAETVLLQLVRGAGTTGLAAIRPGPAKPILALRRAETRSLCTSRALVTIEDPMNADPAFRRNRVRSEVIPLLDDIAGRDTVVLLARAAALLDEDDRYLDDLASVLDPTDARSLAAAPPVLARRSVRAWLTASSPPYPPDLATVERVLEVARGTSRGTDIGAGRRVERTAGRLRVAEPGSSGTG